MSSIIKLIGAEMSPYSVKVRAYFRYKGIDHIWGSRFQNQDEYKKHARLPLIPLVILPDGSAMQDSTPIIDAFEAKYPDPTIHPDGDLLGFLSALIEEFGDEWGNKLMFHFRWWDPVDQNACARGLARSISPDGSTEDVEAIAAQVRERMTGRGHFVGSSKETAPLIERYFDHLIAILESHLSARKYLFGDRPAFADFGLAPQLYEMARDPTSGAILQARTPHVLAWAYRMLEPHNDGPFETWDSLRPTLMPILITIGSHFLPWSTANAKALMAGEDRFTVDLDGDAYSQGPQKYHARSLKALRDRYASVADKSELDPILSETGCLAYLT